MPWTKTPTDRKRDTQTYGPEYKRNKTTTRHRSGGRCEWIDGGTRCNSRDRVQCDHIIPISAGGTHATSNLRDLCKTHHDKKTAQEGGGYRRPSTDPATQPRTQW